MSYIQIRYTTQKKVEALNLVINESVNLIDKTNNSPLKTEIRNIITSLMTQRDSLSKELDDN